MALSVLGRAFGVRSSKLLMERGGNLALLQQVFAKTETCRSMVSGVRDGKLRPKYLLGTLIGTIRV